MCPPFSTTISAGNFNRAMIRSRRMQETNAGLTTPSFATSRVPSYKREPDWQLHSLETGTRRCHARAFDHQCRHTRIKSQAMSLEDLLPENLREVHQHSAELPVYAWVNLIKIRYIDDEPRARTRVFPCLAWTRSSECWKTRSKWCASNRRTRSVRGRSRSITIARIYSCFTIRKSTVSSIIV